MTIFLCLVSHICYSFNAQVKIVIGVFKNMVFPNYIARDSGCIMNFDLPMCPLTLNTSVYISSLYSLNLGLTFKPHWKTAFKKLTDTKWAVLGTVSGGPGMKYWIGTCIILVSCTIWYSVHAYSIQTCLCLVNISTTVNQRK